MKAKLAMVMTIVSTVLIHAQILEQLDYIPSDGEIQYYMNLYERLKSIDKGEQDIQQLGEMYSTFENRTGKYYQTYQRLLFESYLLATKSQNVEKFITDYFKSRGITDGLSAVLMRLYSSKAEKYQMNKEEYTKYNYQNALFDENINLFNMDEITLFNNQLGLMLFDNKWTQLKIEDSTGKRGDAVTFVFGGGTNAISITIKQLNNIDFKVFESSELKGKFYYTKYSNFKISELERIRILNRAGADRIYLGIGRDKDSTFKEIENYSVVLYLYSSQKKIGYVIDYSMNISPMNNNYSIRDSLYNHLLFQIYLSFIN